MIKTTTMTTPEPIPNELPEIATDEQMKILDAVFGQFDEDESEDEDEEE